jgi:hypothetical protein
MEVTMTTNETPAKNSADIDAFMPLVASAWKEGELTDLELAAVCLEIMRDPSLDLTCKETLDRWLDSADAQSVPQA